MRVYIIANYHIHDASLGITKKIRAQITTLRDMGHEVFYTAYLEDGVAVFDNADQLIERKFFPIHNKKVFRFARMFFLNYFAREYAERNTFDLAFIRWGGLDRAVIKLLKTLRKNCSHTIMDTHGYFKEQKGSNLIASYISYSSSHNQYKVRGLMDLVLSETNEQEIFSTPVQRYDNGVDVNGTRMHQYCGDIREMNMISVANERVYHGYDRVIRSVAHYREKGMPVKLHLVGVMSDKTKELIKDLHVEDAVILYGKRYGEELDDIYDKCNIGVGPVGQHRVGGKQGTGLKTKEYFAKGLPYFYSGNELLVPKEYPYIFEVPSDESLIDLEKIYAFYNKVKCENVAEEMRDFARKNFSWTNIFQSAFEKLGE